MRIRSIHQEKAKGILWIDGSAIWDSKSQKLFYRDKGDIEHDLNRAKEAALQNGVKLLIRPHPSQNLEIFDGWIMQQKDSKVDIELANKIELLDLLKQNSVVMGYGSTVLLQAIYAGRSVVQLGYNNTDMDSLPVGIMWLAWLVKSDEDFLPMVAEACANYKKRKIMYDNFSNCFSTEPAAPKVVELILSLLNENKD